MKKILTILSVLAGSLFLSPVAYAEPIATYSSNNVLEAHESYVYATDYYPYNLSSSKFYSCDGETVLATANSQEYLLSGPAVELQAQPLVKISFTPALPVDTCIRSYLVANGDSYFPHIGDYNGNAILADE